MELRSQKSIDSPKNRAAAYLRVSTEKQSEEGYSIPGQLEAAMSYALRREWELIEDFIFKESKPASHAEGHKINKLNIVESFKERPELTKLLLKAEQKGFDHLIVYSRDRLSRVVEDAMALEVFLKYCGVEIHYIKEGEDFEGQNDKIKRLLHIIFTSIAEMEIGLLSSRIREGSRSCIIRGRWAGGKTPLGYVPVNLSDASKTKKKKYTILEKSNFESSIVERVFELYASGLGYRRVASIMQREYGTSNWTKSKVEGIIKNETYTGKIVWGRRTGRRGSQNNSNSPVSSHIEENNIIVDKQLWKEISAEREKRNTHKDPYYYQTSYILKDRLVCSKCNGIMKPKNPGKNKQCVYMCSGKNKDNMPCKNIIPAKMVEEKFLDYMRKEMFKLKSSDEFWSSYNEQYSKRNEKYLKQIEEANKQIRRYEELNKKVNEKIITISKDKDNEKLIYALESQCAIYNYLSEKLRESISHINKRKEINRISKEEFDSMISMFIPGLFSEMSSKEITRIRREFIVRFIDRVNVSYNKNTNYVIIENIEFTPPEFM